ncbi:uncharacterized protein LOC141706264 [Apium graveolens]|uniref:uncharacterized protein LOC141706264 n=1 Tax=Apium graveolens TaxID=4045 RepID=UPI003D78FEE1
MSSGRKKWPRSFKDALLAILISSYFKIFFIDTMALQFMQENPVHKLKFLLNLLVENCLFLILNESRKNLPRDMLVVKLQQLLQIVLTKNLGHSRNNRLVLCGSSRRDQ